jgi:hypothetical protein
MINKVRVPTLQHSLLAISLLLISHVCSWPFMYGITVSNSMVLFTLFFAMYFFALKERYNVGNVFFNIWLYYVLFQIFRGVFYPTDYYSYKAYVNNSLILLIAVVVFIFSKRKYFYILVHTWFKYFLIVFILAVIPLSIHETWFNFLSLLSLALIFFTTLKGRYKMIVAIVVLLFMTDLLSRASFLKITVFFLISISITRKWMTKTIIKTIINVLFLSGFLFFILGLTGVFNVFRADEYMNSSDFSFSYESEGQTQQESILNDTRTFLFQEVLISTINSESVLFGRSPGRGYKSAFFQDTLDESMKNGYNVERTNVEVGLLGIYLWTGIFGVILYTLLFYSSAMRVFKLSKNKYMFSVSVALSFLFVLSWIEVTAALHISYLLIFILIGMCHSKELLNMTDKEFSKFISKVFSFR